MSEHQRTNGWVTAALCAALVVLFAVSMYFGAQGVADGEEGFAGTDSIATEAAEESGAEPWFDPIFESGSGEIEAGLFALQAAIGAGILGFALGRLGRRPAETTAPVTGTETSAEAGTPEPAGNGRPTGGHQQD